MKQYIVGKTYARVGSQNTFPVYAPLQGNSWMQEAFTDFHFKWSHPWSVAGSFKHLYVEMVAPEENPSGLGWDDTDFTIYINDAPTALTLTVPAHAPAFGGYISSAQNITDSVTITPGDRVALGRGESVIVQGFNQFSPMIAWSLTFESMNSGESGYGTSSYGAGPLTPNVQWTGAAMNGLGGLTFATDSLTVPYLHSIIPLNGSVFRLDVQIKTAPGAGATWTFMLVLNEVNQDGTGGTVDTTVTIADSATTGFATFNVPVAVLDRLSVTLLDPGAPDPADTLVTYSIGLRADTDGESALCFDTLNGNPDNTGLTDFASAQGGSWAYTTSIAPTPSANPDRFPMSEYSMSLPGPIDAFSLSHLCVNVNGSGAGTDKSYLFTTRKALADTLAVLTMTGSTIIDVGSGIASYSATTDRLDLQSVAHNTPNAVQTAWAWLVTETTAPPIVTTTYPIRRLRRFALPFDQNKWIRINRVELILQAGVGLSTGQGSDPLVMFRLSRDGGMTWDDELTMSMGKIGEYERRAFLHMLGRARNPVVELTSSDPVFVSWISFTVDYDEGTS